MRAEISCAVMARLARVTITSVEPAGVDVDELVRTDRLDDAVGRHRAAGAEIGRAEDRHLGHCAGIVDQVADAHDVAR